MLLYNTKKQSETFAIMISYLYREGMNYDGAIDSRGCVGYITVHLILIPQRVPVAVLWLVKMHNP